MPVSDPTSKQVPARRRICVPRFTACRSARLRPYRLVDESPTEIQVLLHKLKEIVPNMPRDRNLSNLEIIQRVIDYIVDLQIALESHPVSGSGRSAVSGPRQPLGVIASPPNSAENTAARQVNPMEMRLPQCPNVLQMTSSKSASS